MLVKGFRFAKMSQKTRGARKRLNRYLVTRLKATPVDSPSVAYSLTRQPLDLLITF